MKFRLINHKFKTSKNVFQNVRILIDLPMLCATKTMEQLGPNLECGALWRDVTTITSLIRDLSVNAWWNLTISSTNIKYNFCDAMVYFLFHWVEPKSYRLRGISLGGRTLGTPVYIAPLVEFGLPKKKTSHLDNHQSLVRLREVRLRKMLVKIHVTLKPFYCCCFWLAGDSYTNLSEVSFEKPMYGAGFLTCSLFLMWRDPQLLPNS